MIDKANVEKMENGRDKQLMEILADKGKPYERKHDGYAIKMEEDHQLTYTDYNNTELTMTIPKGSYIMVGEDSSRPKIVTEKEFEDANEFCDEEDEREEEENETEEEEKKEEAEEEKPKKSEKPKIGMALIADQKGY